MARTLGRLARPVQGADPARLQAAQVRAAAMGDADLVKRVRRAIRVGFVTGGCAGDDVARSLVMNRRTLNRRLAVEGTTFQALLDDVRHQTACQLLAGSRLSLDDVAAALGYGGVTQFLRRFRQWTGVAPGAWRRLAGEPPVRGRRNWTARAEARAEA